MSIPENIRNFLSTQEWIFAKTFELTWPHEYILRHKVTDTDTFNQTIEYFRAHGYVGKFYKREITYFDLDGKTYWEMGTKPVEETVVINRCNKEQSYESRLANNDLPLPKGTPFPAAIRSFVEEQNWTFAKSYAKTWPHEYIVREHVDEQMFEELVRHIRVCGYEGKFYKKTIIYFDSDGMTYWTTDSLLAETTIINRCKKGNSYEARLKNGTLPP